MDEGGQLGGGGIDGQDVFKSFWVTELIWEICATNPLRDNFS